MRVIVQMTQVFLDNIAVYYIGTAGFARFLCDTRLGHESQGAQTFLNEYDWGLPELTNVKIVDTNFW